MSKLKVQNSYKLKVLSKNAHTKAKTTFKSNLPTIKVI